jgi:hypothetical protein
MADLYGQEFLKIELRVYGSQSIAHAPNVDPALTKEPRSTGDQKQPMTVSQLAQTLTPPSLPRVDGGPEAGAA